MWEDGRKHEPVEGRSENLASRGLPWDWPCQEERPWGSGRVKSLHRADPGCCPPISAWGLWGVHALHMGPQTAWHLASRSGVQSPTLWDG